MESSCNLGGLLRSFLAYCCQTSLFSVGYEMPKVPKFQLQNDVCVAITDSIAANTLILVLHLHLQQVLKTTS